MIDRETFAGMVIANGKMVANAAGVHASPFKGATGWNNSISSLSPFGLYTPVTVSSYTVTRGKDADVERDQSRD
ncbi:hypothetical protein GE253_16225 [Niveispirillum sp. SYP-B3756]|uniref:hypothetical protein n=1 Tax=Niveispirillum sp. SYP-B3756 TaxID=2662178 RepID=UPI0012924734|nr:hypothetical protein [Niveispirillum sp. SYP-B3756]MQP66882.1 hypothetical protein [Niveispirillum sp. SYP-B3756]